MVLSISLLTKLYYILRFVDSSHGCMSRKQPCMGKITFKKSCLMLFFFFVVFGVYFILFFLWPFCLYWIGKSRDRKHGMETRDVTVICCIGLRCPSDDFFSI